MPLTLVASSKSADAPDIEEGRYPADFTGVAAKTLENSAFGNPDVFIWGFTAYDAGEPVSVEHMTSQSVNVKSKTTPKAVKVLKALLTKAEFQSWTEGEINAADLQLVGRHCEVEIEINDNGWPKVVAVYAAPKAAKPKAEPAAADEE